MSSRIFATGAALVLIAAILAYSAMKDDPDGRHVDLSVDSGLVEASFDGAGAREDSRREPGGQSAIRKVLQSDERQKTGDNDSVQRSVKRAYNAESAQEMLESLELLAIEEPRYAQWRRKDLSHFCNPDVYDSIVNESVKGMRAEFCAGFDWEANRPPGTQEALSGDADDQSIDDFVETIALRESIEPERDLRARLDREPKDNRTAVFTDLLRRARFPEEIIALMSINTMFAYENGMIPLWQMGSELQQAHYRAADLLNAQNVSLYLFGCRRFGGCGSGQYWTLLMCSREFAGKCDQNSTVENLLFQTTPPVDFDLALEILLRLETGRASS